MHQKQLILSLFIGFAWMLWPKASSADTVCDLVKRPENYFSKQVPVFGRIESDRIERTILADNSCAVSLLISGSDLKNPKISELFHAVFDGVPGIYQKVITATISGTLTKKEGHNDKAPTLIVEDVTDLKTN